MINVKMNDAMFTKDMNNIIKYSMGFLDGAKSGHKVFLKTLGAGVIETLKMFIDSNARVSPEILSHVYEWEQTGSPEARLFDIDYVVLGNGISFNSSFRQSVSIKNGSREPFYNKASIMENGIPVTIKPKNSSVLAFKENGSDIFTPNPVTVSNPGGARAEGGFESTFKSFFNSYFSQSILRSSGLAQYLERPKDFSQNLNRGKSGGRSVGVSVGYRWIAKAGTTI